MHDLRTYITAGLTLISLAGLGTGCAARTGTPVAVKTPVTARTPVTAKAPVTATTTPSVAVPSARTPIGKLVVLDEHANNKVVHAQVGTTVELLLHSSYWTIHPSSRPAILAQSGPATQLPVTPTCPPGVGCSPVRAMFTARAPGTAVLSASRTSCGEALRCGTENSSYRVTVIVAG